MTTNSTETTDRHYHNNRDCSEWRRLYHEELYDLYSSNSIQGIKSKRDRVGHVERMGERCIQSCDGET